MIFRNANGSIFTRINQALPVQRPYLTPMELTTSISKELEIVMLYRNGKPSALTLVAFSLSYSIKS